MTSTAATMSLPRRRTATVSPAAWVWMAVIGGLFVLWHGTYILRMILIATDTAPGQSLLATLGEMFTEAWNPDWSHMLAIPLISFYFVMRERPRLVVTRPRVFLPGLALLIFGMLSFVWWIFPGRNDMLQGVSMVIALFGLVLFLLGPGMMRLLWVPVLYMLFFVKVSDRIWEAVANRLQDIAAICSAFVLQMLGLVFNFDAGRTGNHITLEFMKDGQWATAPLAIAEACSGLRMMMAFIALGVAMAFIGKRTWWQRVIMMAMTLPIAIGVNVGRVVILGIVMMFDEEAAQGDFHTFIGLLMLIPAFLLFMLLGWVLDRLVIHDETLPAKSASTEAQTSPATTSDSAPPALPIHSAIGALTGAGLAALVGLNYYLLYRAIKPAEAAATGETVAWLIFAGGLLLLLAAVAGLWRMLRSADREEGLTAPAGSSRGAGAMGLGVATGVLLTGLLGFNAIAAINDVVLIKDAIPLQQKLYNLHGNFGPWQHVYEDRPLSAEEMQYLKTYDYVSYHYRDTSLPAGSPGETARLHMAYYTGTVDTVPHVPDRCMTAGGAEMVSLEPVTLHLSPEAFSRREDGGYEAMARLAGGYVSVPGIEIHATLFRYRLPGSDAPRSVIYFFIANDKYFATPEGVRLNGFNPRDRYSYYCKVEVNVDAIGSKEKAAERVAEFLETMLPEIMACLPDWDAVLAGRVDAAVAAPATRPQTQLEK